MKRPVTLERQKGRQFEIQDANDPFADPLHIEVRNAYEAEKLEDWLEGDD